MKNKAINIGFVCILLLMVVSSCYEDESTLPAVEYPDIVADRSNEGSYLTAVYGEQFLYEPKLGRLDGRDTLWLTTENYDDFNYSWKITLAAGTDTAARVISQERVLDVVMTSVPNTGSYNYALMLQVMHKLSGVTKQLNWNVKVLGAYSSGLLVADTKDGQTSDISLIMSRCYNDDIDDYSKDVTRYDIYSKANNNKIEGNVSTLSYLSYYGNASITALIKGKSLIQVDPTTMMEQGRDFDLFFYRPEVYNPQEVFSAVWGSYGVLINGGLVHYYQTYYGMKYSYTPESEYNISEVYIPLVASSCDALLFDKRNSKFMRFTSRGNAHIIDLPASDGVFDPTNMQNLEPVYGDVANNSTARCLMKKGDDYFIYEIASRDFSGSKIYDMSNCVGLDKATCYAFSEANDEFYYGIGEKLYVAILNTDKPSFHVAYENFGENEKVTHVLMHKGDGATTWGEKADGTPLWRDSGNNLLSVATYNESTGEGKIYALPIQYGGDGGIAADKYIRVFDRFGQITAIATK